VSELKTNNPQITELIEAADNVELVRDQIAALLSLELQNQHELAKNAGTKDADDYDIEIYVENSRPYDTTDDDDIISLVNIVCQQVTAPHSNPRMGNQKSQAIFDIYCIANGNSLGDFRDDKSATFRAWKIMRLIRQIVMSEQYAYLGMRRIVTSRTFTKMESGTPNPGSQGAKFFSVIKASLEVQFVEGFIDGPSVPFDGYAFEVSPDDGQVIAEYSIADRVTGVANNNPPEEE